ncbi:MAG TPA: hypothetical protein VII16_16915 [Actinomycetes bacterium]|jgi:hypothetical protein
MQRPPAPCVPRGGHGLGERFDESVLIVRLGQDVTRPPWGNVRMAAAAVAQYSFGADA